MDDFARQLLDWYAVAGRKDLPWQHPRSPYRVWVSEIMLQQTQVVTVIPYFQRFVTQLPTVTALAEADPDQILSLWTGLGYYARARNLHAAARWVCAEFGGQIPGAQEQLEPLPGIGRSTAGAIRAQAFGERGIILDGNVRRVLARFHALEAPVNTAAGQQTLWQWADHHTPNSDFADYAQAIMDLGATICGRTPLCEQCPLQYSCAARATGQQSRLPVIARKPAARRARKAWLWLLTGEGGDIYLQKRPPSGIWGSLYCPPLQYMEEDAQPLWPLAQARVMPARKHAFSHFDLEFNPVVVSLGDVPDRIGTPDEGVWYVPGDVPPGGLPAPVLTLMQELKETRYGPHGDLP